MEPISTPPHPELTRAYPRRLQVPQISRDALGVVQILREDIFIAAPASIDGVATSEKRFSVIRNSFSRG